MALTTVDTNNKLIRFTKDINREFVRENLFCQPIPSSPIDVNTTFLFVTAATTTRERFATHETNPSIGAATLMPVGSSGSFFAAFRIVRSSAFCASSFERSSADI